MFWSEEFLLSEIPWECSYQDQFSMHILQNPSLLQTIFMQSHIIILNYSTQQTFLIIITKQIWVIWLLEKAHLEQKLRLYAHIGSYTIWKYSYANIW